MPRKNYGKWQGMAHSRPDKDGVFRKELQRNKKIVYASQNICGICGLPVDMNLKYPNPMCPSIDHIIPIAKGGHPSALENLQLVHLGCNRSKGDKILLRNEKPKIVKKKTFVSNDWANN